MQVAIIGAGISGLAAANLFKGKGYRCRRLREQSRTGRTHTVYNRKRKPVSPRRRARL